MRIFEKSKQVSYYVDRDGNVFAKRNGKFIQKKATTHKRGYVYVRTVTKNYQLHRLVACAYIKNDNPSIKKYVNHLDGNKTNNTVKNLEWVTCKENSQHAIKNGLTNFMKKNEGRLKYTNKQCKDVVNRVKNGMTYIKAGIKYGMPYSTVAHLIRGSRREIL